MMKKNMTESEPSNSNPCVISGNNADSSDQVAMRNGDAVPTEEDAECFFVSENIKRMNGLKSHYTCGG